MALTDTPAVFDETPPTVGPGVDAGSERQTQPIIGLINSDSIAGSDWGINAPIGGSPDMSSSAGKPC